jgi:hypothetical protein
LLGSARGESKKFVLAIAAGDDKRYARFKKCVLPKGRGSTLPGPIIFASKDLMKSFGLLKVELDLVRSGSIQGGE